MILKNKRTRETLEIEYAEFRKKFAKEIQRIFGRAMLNDSEQARKVPVAEPLAKQFMDCFARQSAGTPNNPKRMHLKVIAKHS